MLNSAEHVKVALLVQLRKVANPDIATARRFLAELAEGRAWIGAYIDAHTEVTFERLARAALREVVQENAILAAEAQRAQFPRPINQEAK